MHVGFEGGPVETIIWDLGHVKFIQNIQSRVPCSTVSKYLAPNSVLGERTTYAMNLQAVYLSNTGSYAVMRQNGTWLVTLRVVLAEADEPANGMGAKPSPRVLPGVVTLAEPVAAVTSSCKGIASRSTAGANGGLVTFRKSWVTVS